jgi:hypothetical protein
MSDPATPASPAPPAAGRPVDPSRALLVGLAGTAVTALGVLVSGPHIVATAWLVGLCFWTAIALGMLFLVLIHHIFDAMWTTVLRRQFEHGLAAFKWLALLFAPLFIFSWIGPRDMVWPWLNPAHLMMPLGKTVGEDVDYAKKSALLNFHSLVIWTAAFFAIWIWLSARLRKASFSQDSDGDPRWTRKNRYTAAMGIPLVGLSLTAAAILWIKSLEYHWFSTIYGVWFFADCMRGAYSIGVIIMLWLYFRGDYRGILNKNHLHSIGQMMLAFTVFWGYIAFSQYFLIWNANVPEETFWYNVREYRGWWWIGMVLVFGHFLVPFLLLLSYRFKVTPHILRRIACWILGVIFLDICWNILPSMKDAQGNALPFLSLNLVWALTATIGVGGICAWAYLGSFGKTKLFPIRDPRIGESLTHHE